MFHSFDEEDLTTRLSHSGISLEYVPLLQVQVCQ